MTRFLLIVALLSLMAAIVCARLQGVIGSSTRPTCPKSGGECSCKYCACPDGCPGVCRKPCCEVGK